MDEGKRQVQGSDDRQRLGFARGFAVVPFQRVQGSGRGVLGLVQVLEPYEGLGETEDAGEDVRGVARVLRRADGAVRRHPGRVRLVLPDERCGKGLVRTAEKAPAPGS